MAGQQTSMTLAACGIAVALLGGCATDPNEKYAFREGWRRGAVLRVVNGSELDRPDFWECTRRMPQADRRFTDFAIVSYRGVSRQETRALPLLPGMRFAAEDRVYINLNTCDPPLRREAVS